MSNRDARRVSERRLARIRSYIAADPQDPRLDRELAEIMFLRLWRGQSLTGFASLTENVLQIDPQESLRNAERGANALGRSTDTWTDEAIAAWIRVEAGLLAVNEDATVRAAHAGSDSDQKRDAIQITLDAESAPEALMAVSRTVRVLAQDRAPREGSTPSPRHKRPREE